MFRSLDAKTGRVRWETNVRDGAAKQYFFHGDVLVTGDRIVASADVDTTTGAEAGIHAFDRQTGRQLWKYPAGRGVMGAVVGGGGRVFAYTATGELLSLNLASGRLEWTYALKAAPWESPIVMDDRVLAGSNDGSVYALDAETGRVRWQQKLSAGVGTSIRGTAYDAYVGAADGTVSRFDPSSGEIRSSIIVDPALKPTAAPLVTADSVLVLLADGEANYRAVVSVDRSLARIKWRQNAPTRWTTSRIFATERVMFLGAPTGEVTAYCVSDGSLGWSHKFAAGEPIRVIGGSDETLFVGTPQGTLYAIRTPQACTSGAVK